MTQLNESMASTKSRLEICRRYYWGLNLVASYGYSVREAAGEVNVPQTTLSFHLRNVDKLNNCMWGPLVILGYPSLYFIQILWEEGSLNYSECHWSSAGIKICEPSKCAWNKCPLPSECILTPPTHTHTHAHNLPLIKQGHWKWVKSGRELFSFCCFYYWDKIISVLYQYIFFVNGGLLF